MLSAMAEKGGVPTHEQELKEMAPHQEALRRPAPRRAGIGAGGGGGGQAGSNTDWALM
jgi:hypothetical protein